MSDEKRWEEDSVVISKNCKGYSVWVKWMDEDWGFRFFIVDRRQKLCCG